MNGNMKNILIAVFTVMALISCGADEHDIMIRRLDMDISYGKMPEDSVMRAAAEDLFELSGYGELSDSSIEEYARKPSISVHREAVESIYTDMRQESKVLGRMFSRMRELLPDVAIPEIFTIISPYNQSVIVFGSMVYIGLNHYLGIGYEPYGYFPDYLRWLKVRERIPIDVAEAIVRSSYPYSPQSDYPTALSQMAYEGAVALTVMRVAGVNEAEALGYDEMSFNWLADNERSVWDAMVSRRLIFSTDYNVRRSLLSPAPSTSLISPSVPGRAGRYVGLKLVESYLGKHPSAGPDMLLSPDFYESPDLLRLSGYATR